MDQFPHDDFSDSASDWGGHTDADFSSSEFDTDTDAPVPTPLPTESCSMLARRDGEWLIKLEPPTEEADFSEDGKSLRLSNAFSALKLLTTKVLEFNCAGVPNHDLADAEMYDLDFSSEDEFAVSHPSVTPGTTWQYEV